jgi:hypothetical protein
MRTIAPGVFVALAAPATAQVTQAWVTTLDGGGDSSVTLLPMSVAPTGEILVGGGSATPQSDPFVAKLDASGAVSWSRTLSLPGVLDIARSVALSPLDGSAYVLSSTVAYNQPGMRLIKLDAAGNELWTRTYATPSWTELAAQLQLDTNENVTYAASVSPPGGTQPAEEIDVLVESYTAAGALRWSVRRDGSMGKGDQAVALAAIPGGGSIVVGSANGLQSLPTDSFAARVSDTGAIDWWSERSVATGRTQQYFRVVVDPSGASYVLNLVALGTSIEFTEVVALSPNGVELWSHVLPGVVVASDLVLDGAGSVYVTGTTPGAVKYAYLAKLTTAGVPVWERTWDPLTPQGGFGQQVAVDPSGDVTVAGVAYTLDVGHYDTDVFVLRWSPLGDLRFAHLLPAPGMANDQLGECLALANGSILLSGWRGDVMFSNYGPTDGLVLRFDPQSTRTCIGDGVSSACPCGNTSPVGAQAGCTNSVGTGAQLADSGTASLGADTLVLGASGETPNAPTLLVQGSTRATATSFGDGLRCVGGTLVRLYTRDASSGAVAFPPPGGLSLSARSAAAGHPIAAGTTRLYQSYYRDPNPAFCPAPAGSTWNMSNGLVVRWSP